MADISAGGAEFRAGRVISRSFSTFFRNIVPFGLLALVITAPTYIYSFLTLPGDLAALDGSELDTGYGSAVVGVVQLLLSYLVMAALVYGTLQDLKNNKVSIGECFSQGLARMFPALGVAILSLIVIALACLPLVGVAFYVDELGGFSVPATLILIIPPVMVLLMLWVTVPVAVTERRGIGSLGRSMELTKGYRWRVFFLVLMLFAIAFALTLLIGGVIAGLAVGGGAKMGGLLGGIVVVQWIFAALLSSFMAVVYAVAYHDLRVAKEGVDSDQIAAVFD